MTAKLLQWNTTYSDRFRVWSIGTSVQGRSIWATEVSYNLGSQEVFKPNVKYIGNMHGDEVVGRELLMNFLTTLVTNTTDASARALLNSANVFIVPTMNPDGFARGVRANANGVDLNRNFPDQFRATATPQKEVTLMMNFLGTHQWTLSANFHGGDLVANYPWDGRPDSKFRGENKSPDDDTFQFISKTYARTNLPMLNNHGDSAFHDGIVNGAAWYVLYGGMQDFNYIHHGCLEVTLEVSVDKWPVATELPNFWNDNRDSMFNYLSLVNVGARGRVFDAETGRPIAGANVTVVNRDVSKVTVRKENGAWFRVLPPGSTAALKFEATGYNTQTEVVTIPSDTKRSSTGFYDAGYILVDVHLSKLSAAPAPIRVPTPEPTTTTTPTPGITSTPHVIHIPPSFGAPSPVMHTFPLLSSVDSWAIPMFGIAGAFMAIIIGFIAYTIYQMRGGNVAFAQLPGADA